MYTVLELPGKEDIITDYVNQISSRESSRLLIDEDVINNLVMTVDELEDGPRDILSLQWAEVSPEKGELFYQIIDVDDNAGTTRVMVVVDHKLNRFITQVETGDGFKTYTHLGFLGNQEEFLDWMHTLGISKEDTEETFNGGVFNDLAPSFVYSDLCISKYEKGSKDSLLGIVRTGLEKSPKARNECEEKLCAWYKANATNGKVLINHVNELHGRIYRVLDKL